MFKGFLVTMASVLLAGAVAAQTTGDEAAVSDGLRQNDEIANNSAFGDWLVNCEAVTVNRTTCRLIQQLSRSDDNSLLVRMLVLQTDAENFLLLAQTPNGVYLPGGAVYRFAQAGEEVAQREMTWQRCQAGLCEAAILLTPEELALFDQYDNLLFGYRMGPQSEPLILSLDISQFGEAIQALKASRN